MINTEDLRTYSDLKQQLCLYIHQQPDQLIPFQRRHSEGLARFLSVGPDEWSYTAETDGWSFRYNSGDRVFIRDTEILDPSGISFSAQELTAFLAGQPQHANINVMVVDIANDQCPCVAGLLTMTLSVAAIAWPLSLYRRRQKLVSAKDISQRP